jgi:hypothetical protein
LRSSSLLFLLAYWIHSGNQHDCIIWHHMVTKEKQIKVCPLHPLETIPVYVSLSFPTISLVWICVRSEGHCLLLLQQGDSTLNPPKACSEVCVLIHLLGFLFFISCNTLIMAV